MTCTKLPLAGGGVMIACTRTKRAACRSCSKPAGYICDGCDAKLCDGCRLQVMHSGKGRDFCPACFKPHWSTWLQACRLGHLPPASTDRLLRREAFRTWATSNHEAFGNIPLTKAGAR